MSETYLNCKQLQQILNNIIMLKDKRIQMLCHRVNKIFYNESFMTYVSYLYEYMEHYPLFLNEFYAISPLVLNMNLMLMLINDIFEY